MAADTDNTRRGSSRFEDIDWNEVEQRSGSRPLLTTIKLGSFALFGLLALYDAIRNGPFAEWLLEYISGGPQAEYTVLGIEVATGAPTFDFGSFVWDVTGVDWLFVATLMVMFWYAVVPLARNPRMTRYYWRQFRKNRAAVISMVYLVVIFLVGTIVPLFISVPTSNFQAQLLPPVFTTVSTAAGGDCLVQVTDSVCRGTMAHPLGTTRDGRDILKLVIFGMRVSMQIGLIATLMNIVIATAIGASAAYMGGWVDELLMRYVDIQLTFPQFFLFLLLSYLFEPSLFLLIMIFGLFGWGGISRIVRSEALQRTEEEYFKAAQSAGASPLYVVRRHVVPNVSNSIITAATLAIPGLILAEAAFAFLGLSDPTIPSWGTTISAGRNYLGTAWWVATIPGLFLFFTILAFNFIGDALRDALDPRQE
ncbi:ABC transporter permease [Halomarina oriensis]|uniref:ABC transporter permease subunit n=1 Tax=Halomarina oriensis TaxID=671145 RepID=A0A6B0GKX7_9EURY|nr:ABC transporter permease [Halomarina oriensis]MWG34387.1 ABC transporter permease subunit [Halomarina oriensis]